MKKTYTVFMFLFLIAQVSFASTVTEKLKEIKNFDIPEDIEFSRIVKVVDGVEIVGISCRKKEIRKLKNLPIYSAMVSLPRPLSGSDK